METKSKTKILLTKKAKKLIIWGTILCLLFVAIMIYYFGATHREFEKVSQKEFAIPGLDSSFVPQGLDYDSVNDKFVVCGYMSNKSASRIYIVDGQTGKTEKYFTLTVELENYKGHAGGIALSFPYAWIAGDGVLYRFNYENALLGKNKQKLEVMDYTQIPNGADFVDILEGKLVVGEFYRKRTNPTDASHHIKVKGGTNKALSLVYEIDQSQNVGIGNLLYGISTTDQAQGFALNSEGKIVLSTSYALPNSILYIYDNPLSSSATKQIVLDDQPLDVYVLDQTNLIKTLETPCMSEEMVLVEDKIYVLFESNCRLYRFVTRTRLKHVYRLEI